MGCLNFFGIKEVLFIIVSLFFEKVVGYFNQKSIFLKVCVCFLLKCSRCAEKVLVYLYIGRLYRVSSISSRVVEVLMRI